MSGKHTYACAHNRASAIRTLREAPARTMPTLGSSHAPPAKPPLLARERVPQSPGLPTHTRSPGVRRTSLQARAKRECEQGRTPGSAAGVHTHSDAGISISIHIRLVSSGSCTYARIDLRILARPHSEEPCGGACVPPGSRPWELVQHRGWLRPKWAWPQDNALRRVKGRACCCAWLASLSMRE